MKTVLKSLFRSVAPVVAVVMAILLLPELAQAAPEHELEVVEQTKKLISDLAYYAKYILPSVALAYYGYGSLQRTMAGDDEMKKSKADRTLTNAKVGMVLGFAASPILLWIQKYYS